LHRSLVRRQRVASSATAFTFDLTKGADILVIDVTASPGVDGDALEAAVVKEVDSLLSDGLSAAEVDRAVALINTEYLTSLQSAGTRADLISKFVTYFGDPSLVNAQTARYQEVNRDLVMEFVQAYMGANNRASLIYVPSGTDDA
jgi:predicted Zn-dependent peptidase